jgi:hypothetical protein
VEDRLTAEGRRSLAVEHRDQLENFGNVIAANQTTKTLGPVNRICWLAFYFLGQETDRKCLLLRAIARLGTGASLRRRLSQYQRPGTHSHVDLAADLRRSTQMQFCSNNQIDLMFICGNQRGSAAIRLNFLGNRQNSKKKAPHERGACSFNKGLKFIRGSRRPGAWLETFLPSEFLRPGLPWST